MKTLKCPQCGTPLTLVEVLFQIGHIGPFYYACHTCQLATEYGASEEEAREKAEQLIIGNFGNLNRKKTCDII